MIQSACRVCGGPLGELLYRGQSVSVTSLSELRQGRTEVSVCRRCAHLQTAVIEGIDEYYDRQYNIQVGSEEEDDVYRIEQGRTVFRIEHQVATLQRRLPLPPGARILDYGCGKSATLRRLLEARPDVVPYLFDVSEAYVEFWRRFCPSGNWATYEPPPEWQGRLDVVTSFFSLEHVANPLGMLESVRKLLRPGGSFYAVAPNVMTNWADFVVVDHVNHYTSSSLRRLFDRAGFEAPVLDEESHDGAFVITARKPEAPGPSEEAGPAATAAALQRIEELARYWTGLGDRLREAERRRAGSPAAIYGAGFWGTYISTCLERADDVTCFMDRNPFLQRAAKLGRPVIPPEALPREIQVVYVGLKPQIARKAMADVPEFQGRALDFVYLDEA